MFDLLVEYDFINNGGWSYWFTGISMLDWCFLFGLMSKEE